MTTHIAALLGLHPRDLPAVSGVIGVDGDDLAPGQDPHVLVIRAPAPHHLIRLQRMHARYPEAAAIAIIAVEEADARRKLRYTPGIPADVTVLAPTDDLADAIRDAVVRTERRRRHRTLTDAVHQQMPDRRSPPRAALASLGAALDRAPLGVILASPAGDVLEWNAHAEDLLGVTGADRSAPAASLFDPADAVSEAMTRSATAVGFGQSVTVTPVRRRDVAVELTAAVNELSDGRPAVLLLAVDVTGRRAAEVARDALQTRLQVVRRSQEFLHHASQVLAAATDYTDTLTQLARVAVPTLGDLCFIDVVEGDRMRRRAAEHGDPAQQPLADRLREFGPNLAGSHPAARAARTGGTHWTAEVTDEMLRDAATCDAHYELVKQLGYSGFIAVPLRADDELLGILTLVSCGKRRFGPDDVMLVEEIAERVALVIAKARRYDREHEIAVALQRSMLTALPDLDPWQIAARYVPAAGDAQVGGDWYDAFCTPSGIPVLVVGDVVGHDLEAAAAMGQLRSATRALAWSGAPDPADILTRLESVTQGLAVTDFATVICALLELDDAGARVRWSSAGHPPPVVVRADGRAELLTGRNDPVLGVMTGTSRREHTADLSPGTTLVLYTDGLVERRSQPAVDGVRRLVAEAATLAQASVAEFCDSLIARLADGAEDDVALLAVRVPGTGD